MENAINKKEYNEKVFKEKIVQFLKTTNGKATTNDVVLATGLPTEWTSFTLRKLLDDYPCELSVLDSAEIVYHFDFKKTKEKTLFEQIEALLHIIWKGFTWFFKAWIVFMLFTYLFFNALVLVLLITVLLRSGELLEALFKFMGNAGKNTLRKRDKGVSNKELDEVFSYVFGQKEKDEHLRLEKTLLAYIKQQNGIISHQDIIKVTGCTLHQAKQKATRLVADYQGEIQLTEQGKIQYIFQNLLTDTSFEAEEVPPIWKNLPALFKMNDNDKATNRMIAGVNVFNLIMAFIAPFIINIQFYEGDVLPDWILVTTFFIPFIFSSIFFSIPLVRFFVVDAKNQKVKQERKRMLVLGEVFKAFPSFNAENISPKVLATLQQEDKFTTKNEAEKLLTQVANQLQAESQATDSGVQYHLTELAS